MAGRRATPGRRASPVCRRQATRAWSGSTVALSGERVGSSRLASSPNQHAACAGTKVLGARRRRLRGGLAVAPGARVPWGARLLAPRGQRERRRRGRGGPRVLRDWPGPQNGNSPNNILLPLPSPPGQRFARRRRRSGARRNARRAASWARRAARERPTEGADGRSVGLATLGRCSWPIVAVGRPVSVFKTSCGSFPRFDVRGETHLPLIRGESRASPRASEPLTSSRAGRPFGRPAPLREPACRRGAGGGDNDSAVGAGANNSRSVPCAFCAFCRATISARPELGPRFP